MRNVLLIAGLLMAFNATAQTDDLNWINKNAHALDDLSFLSTELGDKTVVGLGEASHGTSEFFTQKARIVEYLVTNAHFKRLLFECPQSLLAPINEVLQSGQGNLEELMKPMALYNTKEIYGLFLWIERYNEGKAAGDKVALDGFDREDYWADPFTRDKYMAENVVKAYEAGKYKTIVWAHNVHILKDTTNKYPAMGLYLEQRFGAAFYAIGFDTYEGAVNVLHDGEFEAHTFNGVPGSFSGTLAKAGLGAFFLPLEKGPLTGTTVAVTNFYSNWQGFKPLPVVPGADLDALVFIRQTSASVKLGE